MSGEAMELRVSRSFRATPERVYDAFLDPVVAGQFMFATPAGEMVRVEIDARVGGRYVFVDRRDGQDIEHTGEYLELDRPRKLAFSFSAMGSEPDRVEITIAPADEGCEVTLRHAMRPEWAEYQERTEQGWATILRGLATALGE